MKLRWGALVSFFLVTVLLFVILVGSSYYFYVGAIFGNNLQAEKLRVTIDQWFEIQYKSRSVPFVLVYTWIFHAKTNDVFYPPRIIPIRVSTMGNDKKLMYQVYGVVRSLDSFRNLILVRSNGIKELYIRISPVKDVSSIVLPTFDSHGLPIGNPETIEDSTDPRLANAFCTDDTVLITFEHKYDIYNNSSSRPLVPYSVTVLRKLCKL